MDPKEIAVRCGISNRRIAEYMDITEQWVPRKLEKYQEWTVLDIKQFANAANIPNSIISKEQYLKIFLLET